MQLKTNRLAAKDLISTFPNGLGGLETDLASMFGVTLDTDVTETPIGLAFGTGADANILRVTKALLRFYQRDTISGGIVDVGVGYSIKNATNSKQAVLNFQSEVGTPKIKIQAGETSGDTSLLEIAASTGYLTGYTTQDGAGTPLIPETGGVGSGYYYNAQNQFSVPGNSPSFAGAKLYAASGLEVDTVATRTLYGIDDVDSHGLWTETHSVDYFDVGGFYDYLLGAKIKVPSATYAGKYMFGLTVACTATSTIAGLDCTIEILKNGTTVIAKQDLYHPGGDPPFETVARYAHLYGVIDMVSADYIECYVTNNGSGVIIGYDNLILGTRAMPGTFWMFKVE